MRGSDDQKMASLLWWLIFSDELLVFREGKSSICSSWDDWQRADSSNFSWELDICSFGGIRNFQIHQRRIVSLENLHSDPPHPGRHHMMEPTAISPGLGTPTFWWLWRFGGFALRGFVAFLAATQLDEDSRSAAKIRLTGNMVPRC